MKRLYTFAATAALAGTVWLPGIAAGATVANPLCPSETAFFAPDQGRDISLPWLHDLGLRQRPELSDRHRLSRQCP